MASNSLTKLMQYLNLDRPENNLLISNLLISKLTESFNNIMLSLESSNLTESFYNIMLLLKSKIRNNPEDFNSLLDILILQEEFNSPLFASHGIDHSIRTTDYMIEFFNQDIWGIKEQLQNKINSPSHPTCYSDTKCLNSLILTALLHDIGYVEFDLCQENNKKKYNKVFDTLRISNKCNNKCGGKCANNKCGNNKCGGKCQKKTCNTIGLKARYRDLKFLHAILGYNFLKNIPNIFTESSEGMNGNKCDAYKENMLKAIKSHNADSRSTTTYNPNSNGRLFTTNNNNTINREYVQCELTEEPYIVLIRLVDNLDITTQRLSIAQQSHIVILYQKWYKDSILDLTNSTPKKKELENKLKVKQVELQNTYLSEYTPNIDVIDKILNNTNEKEFKFQYSSWILDKLEIQKMPGAILLLHITIKIPTDDSLKIESNIKDGLFQFTRMNESFQSITIDGSPLSNLIDIRINNIEGRQRSFFLSGIDEFIAGFP